MRLVLSAFINPAPTFAATTLVTGPSLPTGPVVGQNIQVVFGTYTGTPTPIILTERWFSSASADGSSPTIVNLSSGSYTPVSADAGRYLFTTETAENQDSGGTIHSVSTNSNIIGPVTNPVSPPGAVSPPVISG